MSVDAQPDGIASFDVEPLLDNAGWMRGLAVEILLDDSMADDVVQEAWVATLRRPPSSTAIESQRSWLRRVVARIATKFNRSHRRRLLRERRPRERPPTPDVENIAERFELQRRLAEVIASLPEHYRDVVFLRYYDEMSTPDIAERLALPVSTVRTRLQRALLRLEQRCSSEFSGDGRDWRKAMLAMLPLGWRGPVAAQMVVSASVPTVLGTLMTRSRVAAAVLVIACAIGVTTILFDRSTADSDRTDTVVTSGDDSPRGDAVDGSLHRGMGPLSRVIGSPLERAGVDPADARSAAREDEDVGQPSVAVAALAQLEIVREGDGPIADADVWVADDLRPGMRRIGRSDERGLVAIDATILRRCALRINAEGYVQLREPRRLRELDDTLYRVALDPVTMSEIVVVDSNDEPLAGIEVWVGTDDDIAPSNHRDDSVGAFYETDRDGRIAFERTLPVHDVRIDDARYATVTAQVDGDESRIVLEAGRELRVRLVDADDHPLAEARVAWRAARGMAIRSHAETDVDGWLELGRFPAGARIELLASAAGHPVHRAHFAMPTNDDPVPAEWTIRVDASAQLDGVVIVPEGYRASRARVFLTVREAVDGVAVAVGELRQTRSQATTASSAPSSARRASYRMKALYGTEVDDDGVFVLDRVPPTLGAAYLLVQHPRLANQIIPLAGLEPDDNGHIASFDGPDAIRLEIGATLSGRIIDTEGIAVAGVQLHVGELFDGDTESVLGRVRSDRDGRFTIDGLPMDLIAGDGTLERRHVFLCAFAPDRLLALGAQQVADSPVAGALLLDDWIGRGLAADLVITAARRAPASD